MKSKKHQREENLVIALVTLTNGMQYEQSWATPVHFGRCLGKGAKWMRQLLRDEKIPGRSQIKMMQVEVAKTGRVYKSKLPETSNE